MEVRTDVSAFPVLKNGLYMGEEGRIMYTMSDGCGKFRHGLAIAWGGWKEGVYFRQMKLSYSGQGLMEIWGIGGYYLFLSKRYRKISIRIS